MPAETRLSPQSAGRAGGTRRSLLAAVAVEIPALFWLVSSVWNCCCVSKVRVVSASQFPQHSKSVQLSNVLSQLSVLPEDCCLSCLYFQFSPFPCGA